MDRTTVFTKTTKGLMEATGKTSHLSRDIRAVLKEVDGKATVDGLQTRLGKLSEAKLEEALQTLAKGDFVREFSKTASSPASGAARTAPPPPSAPAASGEEDLDFTSAIPILPMVDKLAEEAAKQKAQAAAAARAKAEADAKAKAQAAARAKAEAETKAKAQAAARAKAEAEAKAKAEAVARAKAEAEAKAKAEAEAKAKAETEARVKRETEERARKEAEEKARREADELRAKLDEERKAREEAERERKEAAEKAQREADELRAKLEDERKAREEAERRAKEEAERRAQEEAERKAKEEAERKEKEEAERKAKEDAERKAKEEAERKEREGAERKAKEEAERKEKEEAARKDKEEAARKEKEEAERRAKEEAENKAKEEAERKAKEEAARKEREEAERKDKEDAEARAREESGDAERKAREEAERKEKEEAERRAKEEAESKAKEEAERKAKVEADAKEKEAAEQKAKEDAEHKDKEEAAHKEREEAERKDKEEAARRRQEEEEKAARETAEQSQTSDKSGRSLDDLVKIEMDFDAVSIPAPEVKPEDTPPRVSADDVMLKEFEARERREAEEKARIEAEELARRKAEEEAKRAEEERARKDEEGRAPAAADAPERELDQVEEQALLKSQEAETERHFAEMEQELEAEQAADKGRKEVRETREPERGRDKEEIGDRIRAAAAAKAIEAEAEEVPFAPVSRTPVKWGKPVALVLFLLLVIGLVLVQFVSFDGHIPRFEKLAGAYLQQPVKIKALHLSLVPTPHWRLEGVSVGSEGQLKVEKIKATAGLGNMFGDKLAFNSIELESPVLSDLGMAALLFGKPEGQDFKVANIIVKNGKLDSKSFIIPALDAKIAMAENGAWQKIALETPDHKTSLLFIPEGDGAQLEVDTNVFSLPFDASFFLENFSAKGVLRRGELRLSELKGGIYGGFLKGSAVLKWGADWSMTGEVSVRAMDPGRFAPALFEEGALEGKAVYAMRAKSYEDLFAAPRLEGNFEIRKGVLLGVDLGRLLQGGGVGGKTTYAELTGGFVREGGKTQVRQIHLTSGPVSAGGTIDADADAAKRINGRFVVELKSPVAKARSNLTLSGTLRDPRFGR